MSAYKAVYSASCKDYDYEKIKTIIFSHFDSIIEECYKDFDFSEKNVALKPNLLAKRTPDAGITTNPDFSAASFIPHTL